ncbi:MAG: hypothetical protein WBQ14_09825 [Gaiellaceae bacterium]
MEQNSAANGLSEREGGQTLVAAWDGLLAGLSEDWSDLFVEVELRPDEAFHPVALTVSPLNPERCEKRAAFRFRVGRAFGYGAAPSITRRCLQLLDERHVEGRLRLLDLLAQRRPFETQGPVWRVAGRSL